MYLLIVMLAFFYNIQMEPIITISHSLELLNVISLLVADTTLTLGSSHPSIDRMLNFHMHVRTHLKDTILPLLDEEDATFLQAAVKSSLVQVLLSLGVK